MNRFFFYVFFLLEYWHVKIGSPTEPSWLPKMKNKLLIRLLGGKKEQKMEKKVTNKASC